MRLHEFPRHPLTFGPSPVHRLARLTAHLGGAEIWAKREDVSSGLAYGGNKVRKLEYIVPEVLASGADTLSRLVASSPTTLDRWPLSLPTWDSRRVSCRRSGSRGTTR